MAQSQYATYLCHVPVVVLIQYAAMNISWPPLSKFVLATLASVSLAFFFSNWIRTPQFMKKIL